MSACRGLLQAAKLGFSMSGSCKMNFWPLTGRYLTVKSLSTSTTPSDADLTSGKWFPTHVSELDHCARRIIMYAPSQEGGLDAEHPSFKDPTYRKRRMEIYQIAQNYKYGDPLPVIRYTNDEMKLWKTIYTRLRALHAKHACREFLENFALLEKNCGYSENNIPTLDVISKYLKRRSGFTLRPVGGYQTPRDFLACLAFRVFSCTQYLRHQKYPFYTPEPDMVHELMGHLAMLADWDFAQFSQEIGLASLGASNDECNALVRLYFFLVEYGLSLDTSKNARSSDFKVYGAGLLGCCDELQFCVTDKAKHWRFDPQHVIDTEPQVVTFQKGYFFTTSFDEAKSKIREYTRTLKRPFTLRYNAATECVESLNKKQFLIRAMNDLHTQTELVRNATIQRMS